MSTWLKTPLERKFEGREDPRAVPTLSLHAAKQLALEFMSDQKRVNFI